MTGNPDKLSAEALAPWLTRPGTVLHSWGLPFFHFIRNEYRVDNHSSYELYYSNREQKPEVTSSMQSSLIVGTIIENKNGGQKRVVSTKAGEILPMARWRKQRRSRRFRTA
jgi:hypothetical protein